MYKRLFVVVWLASYCSRLCLSCCNAAIFGLILRTFMYISILLGNTCTPFTSAVLLATLRLRMLPNIPLSHQRSQRLGLLRIASEKDLSPFLPACYIYATDGYIICHTLRASSLLKLFRRFVHPFLIEIAFQFPLPASTFVLASAVCHRTRSAYIQGR
jgi:hypothetical protein